MGHSRITLATLLALGLLGTVQADEPGQGPFFIELKGPDGSPPPAVQPQPQAQPVAPVVLPKAQPIVRQVAPAQAGSYGPVRPTDTLWSLASKHRPSNRVSVYQTMVAIYDKNPRSFADGNINHILVGAHILLPSAAEASRITDAQARQRFNSDNASWKGLSPKYLANKHAQPAKAPVATAPKAAPIPVAAPKVGTPPTASEVKARVKVAEPAASAAVASVPTPLPADVAAPVGKPSTEMALALEDANAQLGQVTEMNHRLKLRLQSLTEEVETLKAQLQDQTALQKEVAELKAKPVPPVVAPVHKQNWLMELLTSPLNLAMIILLPVLLVLALVTLWLRARARRELEEQEKSLSESTATVMGEESSEFDQLMTVGIADDEPMRPMPDLNGPDGPAALKESNDVIFSDDGELALSAFDIEPAVTTANRDPDLVPELDLAHEGAFDISEPKHDPADDQLSEEELQAALFADLDMDLAQDQLSTATGRRRDEALVNFDLSDFGEAFDEPADKAPMAKSEAADYGKSDVDDMLTELEPEIRDASQQTAWDPNELALADFEDAFTEVDSHPGEVKPREQAQANDFVAIDKLLAEANASTSEQEPYQGFSLDVGLDGFPEVLPQSTGFDVDADDGGVGAKLDLARAYLEIDDKESARELLQEAAAQGSDHQRTEAERLLKRLG